MSRPVPFENVAAKPKASPRGSSAVLQRITAIVLWAVMLSLAWMVSAAYQPDYFRLFSVEVEIIILLGLLMAALVLVSVVALRHTRLPEGKEE